MKSYLELFEKPLHDLFERANEMRKWKCGDTVTFVIETVINYTNVCASKCKFCAFYARRKEDEYVLTKEQIVEKVQKAVNFGATQVMLQGGLNPDLGIEYFEEIFSVIKRRFKVHLHSLSAPEILYLSKKEKMSIKETLLRLKSAGLNSLPGGGAEILDDEVRERLSSKGSSEEWLKVMKIAHELGLPSTATMVFGHIENPRHIVNHLVKLKKLQDETKGFTAFIPWTFEPGKSELNKEKVSPLEYLKVLAISRIVLDNFRNIQASWLTQGIDIAILSLLCGANDLGGVMIEENVIKATGKNFRFLSLEEIVKAARSIGRTVAQRDTYYRIIRYF